MKLFSHLKQGLAIVKWLLFAALSRIIAMLLRYCGQAKLAKASFTLMKSMPVALFGSQYRLAKQNLSLLPYSAHQRHLLAIRYVIIQQIRVSMKIAYSWMSTEERLKRLKYLTVHDDNQVAESYGLKSTVAVMFHSGDYWMNIIFLMRQLKEPADLVFIRGNHEDRHEEATLRSLENFGHRVHIFEAFEHSATVRLYKSLKQGHRAIVFADLPPDLAGKKYGVPRQRMLFGKPAYFVQGVTLLAAKAGRDLLVLSSRLDDDFNNHLHVMSRVPAADEESMFNAVNDELVGFLTDYADSWYFLPYMETYFHHKRLVSRNRSGQIN